MSPGPHGYPADRADAFFADLMPCRTVHAMRHDASE
jgi:hypothetical protein